MKTQKKYWLITILVAAMVALTTRAHALHTNYLDNIFQALVTESNNLATLPTPTKVEKKQLAEVKKALKDLSKPSDSVAGDYNLFFLAALHLGDVANDPAFATIGEDAFNAFLGEAQAEFEQTSNRVAALNNFVPTKRAAIAQLTIAANAFNTLQGTSNQFVALLLVKQIFARIVKADVLAAKGEAHSGFAADSLVGADLVHNSTQGNGTLDFTDGTNATETEGSDVRSETYTYTRTGLNTATLVLTEDHGGGDTSTTTVKLKFTSTSGGTFSAVHVSSGGEHNSQSGTFTVSF